MQEVAISEFKAKCLHLLDLVARQGDSIVITKRGRPVARVVPVSAAALQMFLMTSASGMGRDDDASVARMYARVTGTQLPGEPK